MRAAENPGRFGFEALAEPGYVRKHTKDQAHEVRHFGNGMAHGDFTHAVTQQEA